MSRTQLRGDQILDGSITSEDISDTINFDVVNVSGSINIVNSGSLHVEGPSTFGDGVEISGGLFVATGDTFELDSADLKITSGSLSISGGGILLDVGHNCPTGLATLVSSNGASSVNVANSLVTSSSLIMLTKQTNNHPTGVTSIASKSAGSFSISSSDGGDTDQVMFFIINPVEG
jgi:hypothetical protein